MQPKLRFPEFQDNYKEQRIDTILKPIMSPVSVDKKQRYKEIGIRSHGKGIFYKPSITGKELGNKRVFNIVKDALIFNIVFAWEHALAVTSLEDENYIASHRFPMYLPNNDLCNTQYMHKLFLTDKGKSLLELASPGGAGRNKTLGRKHFNELKVFVPSTLEQTKIADFLSDVDKKISLLEQQQQAWKTYKQGMMQKLFSGELRFKDENGQDFPEWEEVTLEQVSICLDNQRKALNLEERNNIKGNIPYYGANGVVDYIDDYIFDEPLVLLAEDGGNFDEFRTRPIAQLINGKSWVNNHAHVLKSRENINVDFLFFSLVHKDIRQFINGSSRAKLNKSDMLLIKILLPMIFEQEKIADCLSGLDAKIDNITAQLEQMREWKKGLLQQMFV